MRVLWLTLGSPWPPLSGARIRDYELIRHVSARHAVSLLVLQEAAALDGDPVALRGTCDSVEVFSLPTRPWWDHARRYWRSDLPAAVSPFVSDDVARRIGEIVATLGIDVLQIEHSLLAGYLLAMPPGSRTKTVLSLHNVAADQYRRMLRASGGQSRALLLAKWLAMRRAEPALANRADAVIVVSEPERASLVAAGVRRAISVVPNGVDVRRLAPLPDAGTQMILFVGTLTYPPNRDGVLWFARHVLPLVRRRVPNATFVVVGHEPPGSISRLSGRHGIEVAGSVAEVLPYYGRAAVCVAPLRAGGGTRLKILEAMAVGRPVVSTTYGCEGLPVDGTHLLIAHRPEAFATHVVGLLEHPGQRARLAAAARALVVAEYRLADSRRPAGRGLRHAHRAGTIGAA